MQPFLREKLSEANGLVDLSNVRFSKERLVMRRSAKNIDITDPDVVMPWVVDCVKRHYKRHDFRDMLIKHGMSKSDYYIAKHEHNKDAYVPFCKNIAQDACERIKNRRLNLPPITIKERQDPCNGKIRAIGNEGAIQQVLDYIAVYGAMDVFMRRVVVAQVSSIKDRGQKLGIKLIKSWIRRDNHAAQYAMDHNLKYSRKVVYFAKLDIRKCFPTAKLEIFLNRFKRDCGNDDLIWLWEQLLLSHRVHGNEGFMIGALPSCWALQYMLSFVYRKAMDMHYTRRGQNIKVFYKSTFFMDDLLFVGSNRRKMLTGINELVKYTWENFGLRIKPSWNVVKLTSLTEMDEAKLIAESKPEHWHYFRLREKAIDMMGYVIHIDGSATIRKRIFRRIRRGMLRYNQRGSYNLKQAQRACSYKGYVKNSCNNRIDSKYGAWKSFAKAAKVVSTHTKSKAGANYGKSIF